MTAGNDFLPYGRQVIDDDDIAAVTQVLRGDWLTTGPLVAQFESALTEVTGARFAVVCSNGTAALHLAALAAGIGPGDWSIVPSLTFLATANASRMVGAEVWFADVHRDTGLLGAAELDAALESAGDRAVKAVFPVHLNGCVADMEAVALRARERGLCVIEDAAHALGSTYRTVSGEGTSVGDCRFSDMTTFSFHPVKTVTAGEGGAVTTNDPELAERLRTLRNHGMHRVPERFVNRERAFASDGDTNPWYYEMPELGYNYRLTDIQCALGLSQLHKLEAFRRARCELMGCYDELFASLSPLVRPVPRDRRCAPCLHLYPVLVDFDAAGTDRGRVMRRMAGEGIGTQVHYAPVHAQPFYERRYGAFELEGARSYYERVLSLPFFSGMAVDAAERVVGALKRALSP